MVAIADDRKSCCASCIVLVRSRTFIHSHIIMTTITLEEATSDVAVDTKSNKPVQTFRHKNISASIFENVAKTGGTFYVVTLQRTYKDGEEFKHCSSFGRDEIPVAQYVLAKAWEFMLESGSKQS